jgi:hypothetical protein
MSFRIQHASPETEELASEILNTIESWICEQNKSTTFLEFSAVQLAAAALADLCWINAENCTAADC